VNAKRRVEQVKKLMEQIGLEPGRLSMVNLSSAMGKQFAELMQETTQRIAELGPSPLRPNGARPMEARPSPQSPSERQDP